MVARTLKALEVTDVFGVVGRPVTNIAMMAQAEGIHFWSFRNEQAASYAAGAAGYMTGRPAVCLAVSGPGVVHALAGLGNAWANCWPMVLIGGATSTDHSEMGGFQEAPQIETVRPYVKMACRAESLARVPFYIEKAIRVAMYGRPGPTYVELPAEVIYDLMDESKLVLPRPVPPPPLTFADPKSVRAALELLKTAKNPLVIVGKGTAYARAEAEATHFVEKTGLPFLPTPMGKGVLSDEHSQSVAAARNLALQSADVILLLGARLNWILHFGQTPRYNKDVKFIHVEIAPEELNNSVRAEVALAGDIKAVLTQLNDLLAKSPFQFPKASPWWNALNDKVAKNKAVNAKLCADERMPLSYYRALKGVHDTLPHDAIIVSEGANTMDIGRTIFDNRLPRHRLDAGTWGTMGVGMGFAIAAQVVHPGKKVVAIEGDSAFGFSGMEIETMCRYGLNVCTVIINNNGISMGVEDLSGFEKPNVPFFVYTPQARYEKLIEAFGGKGYYVTKPEEIEPAMRDALAQKCPTIVNIMIDTAATRKPQEHPFELGATLGGKAKL